MSFVESRTLEVGEVVFCDNDIHVVWGLAPMYGGDAGPRGGSVLLSDHKWHGWWEIERR